MSVNGVCRLPQPGRVSGKTKDLDRGKVFDGALSRVPERAKEFRADEHWNVVIGEIQQDRNLFSGEASRWVGKSQQLALFVVHIVVLVHSRKEQKPNIESQHS